MKFAFARKIRVHFRKLPGRQHGLQIDEDIFIDLHKTASPGRIFLHELLHFKYPGKSETQIRKIESRRWKCMFPRERYQLYRNLFSRKWRS